MDAKQREIKGWIDEIENRRLLNKEDINILREEIKDIQTELDEGYNMDYLTVDLLNNENGVFCSLVCEYPSHEIEISDINLISTNRFNNFYESWNFLKDHKMCENKKGRSYFNDCLGITVVKVNPRVQEVDDIQELNTKTEVWLEFGSWCEEQNMAYHDYDLDCGGDTFEEAVIKLANLVWNKYKDNRC